MNLALIVSTNCTHGIDLFKRESYDKPEQVERKISPEALAVSVSFNAVTGCTLHNGVLLRW